MRTIYKYIIKDKDLSTIETYSGAVVLSAKCVGNTDNVSLWVGVDDEQPTTDVEVLVVGTGWELPEDIDLYEYVDTCVSRGGYIWHVYARRKIY